VNRIATRSTGGVVSRATRMPRYVVPQKKYTQAKAIQAPRFAVELCGKTSR
jgi:hypothetical protein